MSIQSEINRIKANVASAYAKCEERGAVLPATENSANLPATIESIPSGGGDVVFAVNNTGTAVSAGDKVWLNRHYLAENAAYQYSSDYTTGNYFSWTFDADDNILAPNASSFYKWRYDPKMQIWSKRLVYDASVYGYYGFRNIDGIAFKFSMADKSSASRVYHAFYRDNMFIGVIGGIYLGQGLCLRYTSSAAKAELCRISLETGVCGEALAQFSTFFTSSSAYFVNAFLEGNVLLIIDTGKKYYFFDISAVLNEEKPGEPILLNSGALATQAVLYATGVKGGDYLFAKSAIATNPVNDASNLLVYKINSDYSIVSAEDLPTDIANMIGLPCNPNYDNASKILTIGTLDNVFAFRFVNGTFVPLSLAITLPPEASAKCATTPYLFVLSADLTSAVIAWNNTTSASSLVPNTGFYKLATAEAGWHADGYAQESSLTFTGFATGNTDENGKIEVVTALPAGVRARLSVSPQPDSMELTGGAQ